MSLTQEQRARKAELELKVTRGEALSEEELHEGFSLMREDRRAAFHASEGARKKKAKAVVKEVGEIVKKLREVA